MKKIKIVVVDDDPTGIQTVYGCKLLTSWSEKLITKAFADSTSFFYILTNNRAFSEDIAKKNITELVRNVLAVNKKFGFQLIFVSRSDSTLRGHFPLETDLIEKVIKVRSGKIIDNTFFVPAFFEGGRITKDNIHYIKQGNDLVPMNKTEFANDSVFGYKNADITKYIEEKTNGRVRSGKIASVSLDTIRNLNEPDLMDYINSLKNKYVVVNSENYTDLDKIAAVILKLTSSGKNFLIRGAASIVKSLARLKEKPLLDKKLLNTKGLPGILIVGSYIIRTTDQMKTLLLDDRTAGVEINVDEITPEKIRIKQEILNRIEEIINSGRSPVLYTSRKEKIFKSVSERLAFGREISEFLVSLIQEIKPAPGFIIAKGGITSADILTDALGVKFTTVLGQIDAGIPVLLTPEECRFPEIPYVIFPGNVGEKETLQEVFNRLV
ncbi:four-carbon acid sugar kinase family protein [candidate division KSB1 bacterium]